MNFNELKIQVPNLKTIEKKYSLYLKELKLANDINSLHKVYKKIIKFDNNIQTKATIINIKYTIDTSNKEYKKASEKLNKILPHISNLSLPIVKEILTKPFRNDIEKKYGKFLIQKYENFVMSFNEKIINDLIEENNLVNKHDEVLGSSNILYKGQHYTITQLGKFLVSKDRETRKEVSKLIENFFKENNDQLGDIYDKMVKVRDKMAHTLGFSSYVDYAYKLLGRVDYNKDDVKQYRDKLYKEIIPIYKKIVKTQSDMIEIKNPQFYDLFTYFKDGNPTPYGDIDELTNKANLMYHKMSKETGDFFQLMIDSNLLSLKATKGKLPGGYMTQLSKYKVPFIFANSNGTADDVETLTHEVGHAFQYYCARNIKIPEYTMPTLEACEIHSMSMEFLTWPYMDLFFKEKTTKFKYQHLANSICYIPYMALVDEFQHYIYENVNITHKQRCEKWRELEEKWLPLKKYQEFDFYNSGTWWLKQNHIFNSPFYYIDYSLAQICAYQFLLLSNKDYDKTWNKYVRFCKLGGKYPFQTLLEKGHIKNPLKGDTVRKTVRPLIKILDNLKEQIK